MFLQPSGEFSSFALGEPLLRNERAEPRAPWREQMFAEMRGFAQTYCACFIAVTAFIA